ncbi:hypothetical protein NHQ30_004439 [Ciborinia camelliae]|nr:hypothetical protein NHQ30_004439 [Ciborinia camelliae]
MLVAVQHLVEDRGAQEIQSFLRSSRQTWPYREGCIMLTLTLAGLYDDRPTPGAQIKSEVQTVLAVDLGLRSGIVIVESPHLSSARALHELLLEPERLISASAFAITNGRGSSTIRAISNPLTPWDARPDQRVNSKLRYCVPRVLSLLLANKEIYNELRSLFYKKLTALLELRNQNGSNRSPSERQEFYFSSEKQEISNWFGALCGFDPMDISPTKAPELIQGKRQFKLRSVSTFDNSGAFVGESDVPIGTGRRWFESRQYVPDGSRMSSPGFTTPGHNGGFYANSRSEDGQM